MNEYIQSLLKVSSNAQDIKQNENDGSFDPFLAFADTHPKDLLHLLHLISSNKALEQDIYRCVDILKYYFIKNNFDGSLKSLTDNFADQDNSDEQKINSLELIKIMVNNTPIDENLDIPPEFICKLFQEFPHSLAIDVCADLIKRDIIYYDQFLQNFLGSEENSPLDGYLELNNFFLELMKQNLYDSLNLLQSFLQYKENLIYLEPIFYEILAKALTCELNEKIECFKTLSLFFEGDDLYYSKLISNKSRLLTLFSDLEEDALLVETVLNLANEVTNSNEKKVLKFMKMAQIDQMIVNVLPFFNNNKIFSYCCQICERLVQQKDTKGVEFLLERDIIAAMDSVKDTISYTSFQKYMHLVSKCAIEGSNSQIISILLITSLTSFAQYADSLDKKEALPFLMKISAAIIDDYETNKNEFTLDEETYDELVEIAEQEDEGENQIADFLNSISSLFGQNETDDDI